MDKAAILLQIRFIELLELILGRTVGELAIVNQQKPVKITPDHRGVRFDVYAKDNHQVVYNVEMQNLRKDSLERRARYSQCMIDQEKEAADLRIAELEKLLSACTKSEH